LHPSTAIWSALLFELIREKYLVQNQALPELSYTAEMIRRPTLLEPRAEIVEAGKYTPIDAPFLKNEDVTSETTADQWERKPSGVNDWMLERYGSQVSEEAMNVIGDKEIDLLPEKVGDLVEYKETLQTLSPMMFGTKEELEKDRLWTARYNQCEMVDALARKEFEDTKDEVYAWYKEKVLERKDFLIEKMVRGIWQTMALIPRAGCGIAHTGIVDLVDYKVGKRAWAFMHYKKVHLFEWYTKGWSTRPLCPLTDSMSTAYHAEISPYDGRSLALILGMPYEDLPWQLQRWLTNTKPHYEGNSILDRLDPAVWRLHSPWGGRNFDLAITVSLSKRGVNRLRKDLGLPRIDWAACDDKRKSQIDPPPFRKIIYPGKRRYFDDED